MMKKRGKIILSLLLLLLLVFILPGLIQKEITFQTSVKVKKPLSSVFVTLGDPARLSHWMTGYEKIDLIRGMPFCEGSKYRLTLNIDDRKYTVVEEIVKIVWKKHLIVDMHTKEMDMRMDLIFFRLEDYTVIEGTYTLTANTPVVRILLPWMKPGIKSRIEDELGKFREMMEKT